MGLIALGVTGGIGAYKAVEVARGLQKRGHEVVAVMTHAATKFVGPVTFEAITRRKVITDQFAVEIAGHYLKTALESGEGVGREMYSLTVDETFKHLDAVVNQPEAQPVE